MARVFIHHDGKGRILSVARVEGMAEDLEHPFLLGDETHGVLEVSEDHPALAEGTGTLPDTHQVDVSERKLVPRKPASKPPRKRPPST